MKLIDCVFGPIFSNVIEHHMVNSFLVCLLWVGGTEPGNKDQGFKNKFESGICSKIEAETVSSVFYSHSLDRLSLMTEITDLERMLFNFKWKNKYPG